MIIEALNNNGNKIYIEGHYVEETDRAVVIKTAEDTLTLRYEHYKYIRLIRNYSVSTEQVYFENRRERYEN